MKITKTIKGQVVGELTLTKNPGGWKNEWEITYVSVTPEYRGKRIASELLEKAKAHAIKKGWVLVGFAQPESNGSMTHDQIKQWLVRHGFKHAWLSLGGYMTATKKRGFEFNA